MVNKIILINTIIFFTSLLTGVISGLLFPGESVFNIREDCVDKIQYLAVFEEILAYNFKTLGLIFLGFVSIGSLSIIILAWNSFLLGTGIPELIKDGINFLPMVSTYILFEFSSLILMASAGVEFGIAIFTFLFSKRNSFQLPPTIYLIVSSSFLMLCAGLLETILIITKNDL